MDGFDFSFPDQENTSEALTAPTPTAIFTLRRAGKFATETLRTERTSVTATTYFLTTLFGDGL